MERGASAVGVRKVLCMGIDLLSNRCSAVLLDELLHTCIAVVPT